jgi:putative transposase
MNKHFGAVRYLHNKFLERKIKYYEEHKKTLSYYQCMSEVVGMKKIEETSWLKEINSQSLQASLMNLEQSYALFFRKVSRFPKFKSKKNKQSFAIPQNLRINADGTLNVPKFKNGIKIHIHRKIEGKIKSGVIHKTASNKYFVSILCEVPKQSKPKTDKSVGIDLGITDFIVTSDGEKIKNPKHGKKIQSKLRKAQKHLSRKKKGSKRREKQRIKVARIYEKIVNSRKDFQHKTSAKLVNDYDIICVESLNIKNMIKNRSLSYSIGDVGWSSFMKILERKCKMYDKKVIKIPTFYPSSKTCSACDHKLHSLPLDIRLWTCPNCGHIHDRDHNAAKNIHQQGLLITNVEMEALASDSNITDETTVNETFKICRKSSTKPNSTELGIPQ